MKSVSKTLRWLAPLLTAAAWVMLAGAAFGAEAGGEHGGITPEKVRDPTLRTVNFVVFAGILIYLLTKKFPIKNFFVQRSEEIAQSLSDLEAKKAAAAQALQEPDGSVLVPEALRPYMGGVERIAAA